MNICELIEASSSQDTLESDQTHKEDDASSKAPDELGAQALTVTTSEGSTNPSASATDAAAANEFTHNESLASSTSDSVDSDSKNDDDEDNSVYNRMIMFVSSNENEYGDQENSSANSGHDDDDYGSSSASKGYGNNNNDENQNLRQFSSGGGGNLGGIGNQSSQFSILSNPIEEECQFELLNHTERFFKLCENPTPSNIENASRYVVPALEFANSQEEYSRIFAYLRQYCFYSDVLLRSLWLDQIQNVTQYLHQEMENIAIEFTEDFNMSYMLAQLINDLMHEHAYQVKKCATSAILFIIEKQLLTNAQIEQLIIPSILNLVKENNEDFHIDCVSLFGKLAPLLGQKLTSNYFLQPFCRLCSSPVFHTRKACAANIIEIANVITLEEVEANLLPHFCEFMKDQVWAIRKVCADSFSQFAMRCRRDTRECVLTEHFIRLLDDNSRWVKIAAYKSLGPFIATFIRTESEKAEFLSRKREEQEREELEKAATAVNNNQNESTSTQGAQNETKSDTDTKMPADETQTQEQQQQQQAEFKSEEMKKQADESQHSSSSEDVHMDDASSATPASPPSSTDAPMPSLEQDSSEMTSTSPNKDAGYSDFMFWRNLVPLLDKNFSNDQSSQQQQQRIAGAAAASNDEDNKMESSTNDHASGETATTVSDGNGDKSSTTSSEDLSPTQPQQLPTLSNLLNSSNLFETPLNRVSIYSSSNNLSSSLFAAQSSASSIEQLCRQLKQDIVPPTLLGHFITMVDINTQNSLDSEMNYNCAFNFPAIALTLGVEHWRYIRDLYKKLAEDVSWKVRQTLAYSIHELAIILGTENTQNDLVPIFDSYIKDVDEVRIGIVANLTKFLRVLSLECRCSYMPKLNDFLKMDNQRNWRFRNELGLQIAEFCPLFPPECLAEYVQPVAFTLALDKISEVRLTAINALIEIFKQFESTNKLDLRRNFVEDVIRSFANSNRWTFRQLYVVMCENMLRHPDQVDFDAFCRDFLPKLFSFRNEKVPNIRLLLARFIATHLMNNERFAEICCQQKPSSSRSSSLTGNTSELGQDLSTSGGETTTAKSSNQLQSEMELTIQYLANDKENDVKCYFHTGTTSIDESCNNNNNNTNNDSKQMTSGDLSMEVAASATATDADADPNEKSPSSKLPKIDSSTLALSSSGTPNESDLPSIAKSINMQEENQQDSSSSGTIDVTITTTSSSTLAVSTSGAATSNNEEDEEEWDEVVDKTKIDKLKIVNLDNEMDDEMDIIIESKENITHLNKAEGELDVVATAAVTVTAADTNADTNSSNA